MPTQLEQFERYVKLRHNTLDSGLQALQCQETVALGFCTGLLTAYTVASSTSQCDLKKYGAVALRLATLVGAVVDSFDTEQGQATSWAATWHTPEQGSELAHVLARFPEEAYTSVLYDERRVTLTVSDKSAPALLKHLNTIEIAATKVGLRGRFHTVAHQEVLDELLQLSKEEAALQLPDATLLPMEVYANSGTRPLRQDALHKHALQALLVQQADWRSTFATACEQAGGSIHIVNFGSERCVPPSLQRRLGSQLMVECNTAPIPYAPLASEVAAPRADIKDNDIAITGLSIKVAGADDVEEFVALLCSGVSQHTPVPALRIPFGTASTPWRPHSLANTHQWFANLIRDFDAFDHGFLRCSPRESAAMDPQQRLLLQTAYQAVEMSGWFGRPASK